MRRVLIPVLCLGLLAGLLAGCGSSSSSGSSNPVSDELAYIPAGSPVVIRIATDPNSSAIKGVEALLNRFPLAKLAENALLAKLDQKGLSFQSDIKPLLGNPIMVSTLSSTFPGGGQSALSAGGATAALSSTNNVLITWVTKDSGKLSALIKKLPNVKTVGSHDGAALYESGGSSTVAINGATLVMGPTETVVNQALDRHQHPSSGFSQATYDLDVAGQPSDPLVQVFGSLQGVLSQPSAAKARQVPLIAATRGYAVSLGVNSSGITTSFRFNTSGRALTPAQIPFAIGSGQPRLVASAPIGVAIQNPAHIIQYILSVLQTVSPTAYAKIKAQEARVQKQVGISLQSVLDQFTGSMIVASSGHKTFERTQVSDPAKTASLLAKIATVKNTVSHSLGGGFYQVKLGSRPGVVGLVGNQLVVGHASPAQLRAFANAPTVAATGAQGSVAFRVSLTSYIQRALAGYNAPPQVLQPILGTIGDLTGWIASTPQATTGSATIAIH